MKKRSAVLYKIIHIVSSVNRINYGIWNAALFGSYYLHTRNVLNVLWVCSNPTDVMFEITVPVTFVGEDAALLKREKLLNLLDKQDFSSNNTIVVTHGSWGVPTRVGYRLSKKDYKWIYTPHGMLEPWSMSHKRLKKEIYFNLYEKRFARQANLIRAVSATEQVNLKKLFKKAVVLVENGLDVPEYNDKPKGSTTFLFMARLHFKKGIFPLVVAWNKMMKETSSRLIIAGPDEGELEKIKPYLSDSIQYTGAVYGDDKIQLLKMCHYFVLPSYSEGFATSVVEAMGYGLIPLISEGCNFRSVFENNLGYQIEPDEKSIADVLRKLRNKNFDKILSKKNHHFISTFNSVEKIGEQLFEVYKDLIQEEE